MKDYLKSILKELLINHKKKKYLYIFLFILSLLTAFGIFNIMMKPAIGEEKSNPLITSTSNNIHGESINITAMAERDEDKTYFCILRNNEDSKLEDYLDFKNKDLEIKINQNKIIKLHKIEEKDKDGFWFVLEKEENIDFDLFFNTEKFKNESMKDSNDLQLSTIALSGGKGETLEVAKNLASESLEKEEYLYLSPAAGKVEEIQEITKEENSSSLVNIDESKKIEGKSLKNNKQLSKKNFSLKESSLGVDFGQYITNITISKKVGNNWVQTEELVDGDSIKVSIIYKLPENIVGKDNKNIYYQFPYGIRPDKLEKGFVYGSDEAKVGEYEIATDGLIKITFDESFADNKAFIGTVEFQGTAKTISDSEDNEVIIGGDGGIIIIKPSKPVEDKTDITIEKSGKYNTTNKEIEYKLRVSTIKGTEKVIDIVDRFTPGAFGGASYSKESFRIFKIDKSGNSIQINGYEPSFSKVDNLEVFEIRGLPKLEAGEFYEITYSAIPQKSDDSKSYYINNRVIVTSGKNKDEKNCEVEIKNSMLKKTGVYDPINGKINWTIIINKEKLDISGYVLSDTLEDGQGNIIKIPEKVDIRDSKGKVESIKLPYTFPENSQDTYTIKYSTDVFQGEGGSVTKYKNTVNIEHPEKPDYEIDEEVTVTHKDYNLVKSLEGAENLTDKGTYKWKSRIILPKIDMDLSKIEYEDRICNGVSDGREIEDSHYTTTKLLDKLEIKLSNGEILNRGIDYKVYDNEENEIFNFNGDNKLSGFKIKFLGESKDKISKASYIELTYKTIGDYTKLTPGVSYKFVNEGFIPKVSSKAEYEYKIDKKLEKQASETGRVNSNTTSYKNEDLIIDYDSSKATIHYRALIRTDETTKGDIVVTDILPKGVKLVEAEGRPKPVFYYTDYYESDKINFLSKNYSISENFNYTISQLEDGSTKVEFVIKDGYNNDGKNNIIGIYYEVSILEDESLEDLAVNSSTYINHISWNGYEDEHKTTVNREIPLVNKTGFQLPQLDTEGKPIVDEEGNPLVSSIISYEIIINPAGKDLVEGNDSILLTDKLEHIKNADAYFLPETVRLYHYDKNKEGNLGAEISSDYFKYSYDDKENIIKFIIPDNTPCILVYEYDIDRGLVAGDIKIKNEVTLSGNYTVSSKDETILKDSSSNATAKKKSAVFYKVDNDDYGKLLPGAEFKLTEYVNNNSKWSWKDVIGGNYITGEDGKIEIDLLNGMSLEENRLYKLVETKAPEGYQLMKESYYFIWMKDGKTEQETINEMGAGAFNNISIDQIKFIRSQGVIYIPNENYELEVKKNWKDENGNEIPPIVDSIKAKLYRQAQDLDSCTVKVSINSKPKVEKEISVARGSSLTVKLTGNIWKGLQFKVNGEIFEVKQENGTPIPLEVFHSNSISEDKTIAVECIGNSVNSTPKILFEDYNNPTTSIPIGEKEFVEEIEIGEYNNWVWSNESLAKYDKNNNPYYYWVEEITNTGANITYLNNDGIITGEIVIINEISSYNLPSTGGEGKLKIYILGTMLMILSVVGILKINSKNKGSNI